MRDTPVALGRAYTGRAMHRGAEGRQAIVGAESAGDRGRRLTRRASLIFALLCSACSEDPVVGEATDLGARDESISFPVDDLAGSPDFADPCPEPNACGDCEPRCRSLGFGLPDFPPFPLQSDRAPDPREHDDTVAVDPNGYLVLGSAQPAPAAIWIANAADQGSGTISRLDSKTMREIGRYFTVTCSSLPGGSRAPCDGTKGCCAADDLPRYRARKSQQQEPPRQPVQLLGNRPSRTDAVATCCGLGGVTIVENRAPGGQASLTRIATDTPDCKDRNHDGVIQTSADVNADGQIQTDCNGDGVADDLAGVKAKPCTNGKAQEFYGLDDECVIATTNVGAANQEGRGAALDGPANVNSVAFDAWATTADGRAYRVDGVTMLITDEVTLAGGCHPDGLTIDASEFAWAPTVGGPLCVFDTRNTVNVGVVRDPDSGAIEASGLSQDRDQNIWIGDGATGDAFRYTPDRSNQFANATKGFWTHVTTPGKQGGATGGARGLSPDSRTPNAYFEWLATGNAIVEIPASTIKSRQLMFDQVVDGSAWPVVRFPGWTLRGLAVDRDQNVVAVGSAPSTVARVIVDQNGAMAPPDLVSPPMGQNVCRAGDRCPLTNAGQPDPQSEPAGSFAAWSCRAFCRPHASWQYIVSGCVAGGAGPGDTEWAAVHLLSSLPPFTRLLISVRSGATPTPDDSWSSWSEGPALAGGDESVPLPALLGGAHVPYLEVKFYFQSLDHNATPRLERFEVGWRCP